MLAEGYKAESRTAWYRLLDGTNGRAVTAFRYIDDDTVPWATLPPPPPDGIMMIAKLRYVRIMGGLTSNRGAGNAISVHAFHVVEDPHEPYTHALTVFANELRLKRGAPVCVLLCMLCGVDDVFPVPRSPG